MDEFHRNNKECYDYAYAPRLAEEYGYALNRNFLEALGNVIKMAQQTQVVALLGCVAEGMLKAWTPPLEKVPLKFIPPQPKPNTVYAPTTTSKTNH